MSPKRRRPTGIAAAALTGVALAMGVQPAAHAVAPPPTVDSNPGAFAKIMDVTFQNSLGSSFLKDADTAFFAAAGATFQKVFPDPAAAASALQAFEAASTQAFESGVGDSFLKYETDVFANAGPMALADFRGAGFDKSSAKSFHKEAGKSFQQLAEGIFGQYAPSVVEAMGGTFDKSVQNMFAKTLGLGIETAAGASFDKSSNDAFVSLAGDAFVKEVPPAFDTTVGTSFEKPLVSTFDKEVGQTFKKELGAKVGKEAAMLTEAAVGDSFDKQAVTQLTASGDTAVEEAMTGLAPDIGSEGASALRKAFVASGESVFGQETTGTLDKIAEDSFDGVAPGVLGQLGSSDQLDAVENAFIQNVAGAFDKEIGASFVKIDRQTFLDVATTSLDDLTVEAGETLPGTPGS